MKKFLKIFLVSAACLFVNIPTTWAVMNSPDKNPSQNASSPVSQQGQAWQTLQPLKPPTFQKKAKRKFHARRFMIKFKPDLLMPADVAFQEQRKFQTITADANDSLDQLNAKHHVQKVKPLFPEAGTSGIQSLAQRQQMSNYALEVAKTKNPRRSARAPKNATLPDLTSIYVFEVAADSDIEKICREYAADPHVEYCQPDYVVEAQFHPNDPYYSSKGTYIFGVDDLWTLKSDKLDLEPVWDVTQGENVIVAVVDTGVNYTHPDISPNIWKNPDEIPNNGIDDDHNGYIDDVRGWDFYYGDNDPFDGNVHGTHVSGTIAAIGNNNRGIIGVAPKATIMPVKALSDSGSGFISGLAQGIVYAAENGADVLNNSWGCSFACPSLPMIEDAVRTAYGLGAVIVMAAGNSGDNVANYSPQNMNETIAVAATDDLDQRAYFSNFGSAVDVAAPGVDILSLYPNGYSTLTGTSMAAPHVSGLAALILGLRPQLTNEEVRSIMMASTDDIGSPGFDPYTGAGRINAKKILGTVGILTAKITSPTDNVTLGSQGDIPLPADGWLTIKGTAANYGFKQYQLFLGEGFSPQTWIPLNNPILKPVTNGILGKVSVRSLNSGPYKLRLVATNSQNQSFESTVSIYIERYAFTPIALDPDEVEVQAVSDDRVVWNNYDKLNTYVYDLQTKTTRTLSPNAGVRGYPDMDGNFVVAEYTNKGRKDIFLYNLITNSERALTTSPLDTASGHPRISGQLVVWDNLSKIYLYDLKNNTERPLNNNAPNQFLPEISEKKVAWLDNRNGNWDIYSKDLTTNLEQPVATNPADQRAPRISNDKIVWEDDRSGIHHVYLFDLTTQTEHPLINIVSDQFGPVISGNLIAWADNRNQNLDIFAYDLLTQNEMQITAHPSIQSGPKISGTRIAWNDYRKDNNPSDAVINDDIYLYDLNLLKNAGFELDSTNWSLTQTVIDSTMSHSGGKSIKITNTGGVASSSKISIKPGKKYQLTGWMKTQALTYGAKMRIVWFNADDNAIQSADVMTPVLGTTAWAYYEKMVTAPAQAVSARIQCMIIKNKNANEAVWFDDLIFSL